MAYSCNRYFYDISGNPVKADNVCGYCRRYKGVMTKASCQTHGCLTRLDGKKCDKYIHIDYEDERPSYTPIAPTGAEYRKRFGIIEDTTD